MCDRRVSMIFNDILLRWNKIFYDDDIFQRETRVIIINPRERFEFLGSSDLFIPWWQYYCRIIIVGKRARDLYVFNWFNRLTMTILFVCGRGATGLLEWKNTKKKKKKLYKLQNATTLYTAAVAVYCCSHYGCIDFIRRIVLPVVVLIII